jgi:hypothetical protein
MNSSHLKSEKEVVSHKLYKVNSEFNPKLSTKSNHSSSKKSHLFSTVHMTAAEKRV